MATPTTKKTPAVEAQAQNIITVLSTGVPTGIVVIPVGGIAYKPSALSSEMQAIVADCQGVQTAETAYHDAVAALKPKLAGYKTTVKAATVVLEQVYAGNTKALTTLGVKSKAVSKKTSEEKAVIAAKGLKTKAQNASLKPSKPADGGVVLYGAAGSSAASAPQVPTGSGSTPAPAVQVEPVAPGK